MKIIDRIKHLVNERNHVVGVFIDFKNAFDTVDHDILFFKLDHYGSRGHTNMFFRSSSTNRCQYTVINGIKSDIENVKYGVSQGPVLVLFIFL